MPARTRGGPTQVSGVQLMQNEAVLEDVTPAWSTYVRSLLFGTLLLLAGLAEAAASDGQNEASGAAVMGVVVFAVIFGYAFYRRSRTHYIVTDSRVVKRTGLFLSSNIEEAGYEMITGVGTDESRFQSLFGNGTVKVATSGGIGTIELVGAPNAKDLANLIRSRHPTLGTRGRGAPQPGAGPGGRPGSNRGAPPGGGNGPGGPGTQRQPPQGRGGQGRPPQDTAPQGGNANGRRGQPPTGEPQGGRRTERGRQAPPNGERREPQSGGPQGPQNGGRQGPPNGDREPTRGQPGAESPGDRREEPTERQGREERTGERERTDGSAENGGDRADGTEETDETDEETDWNPDRSA